MYRNSQFLTKGLGVPLNFDNFVGFSTEILEKSGICIRLGLSIVVKFQVKLSLEVSMKFYPFQLKFHAKLSILKLHWEQLEQSNQFFWPALILFIP